MTSEHLAESAWLPDGRGLADEAAEIIASQDHPMPIHLRLTSPDGRSARGACDRGIGEWWSGIGKQVTCISCLEYVHA